MAGSLGAGVDAGAPWGSWSVAGGLLHPAPREWEQPLLGAQFPIRPSVSLLPSAPAREPGLGSGGCGCLCGYLAARNCPPHLKANKSRSAGHDLNVTAVLGSHCLAGNRSPAFSLAVSLGQ